MTDKQRIAEDLQTWLERFILRDRVINPLRRELERLQRDHEGAESVLNGMNRQGFTIELYRDDGGRLREIPNIGPSAIAALRTVIPAPPGDDDDFTLDGWPPSLQDDAIPDSEVRRGRGRPRRLQAVPETAPAPLSGPTAALDRRKRTKASMPSVQRQEEPQQAVQQVCDAAPEPAPPLLPTDKSFLTFLKLWNRLHPQGRRATMQYIASLVIEQ